MVQNDSVLGKALDNYTDSIQGLIDSLQSKLEGLQAKTDLLYNVVETSNDGVSNQLSAANNLLALVALIMVIIGIWLGLYIAKKKQQIEKMADTIDKKNKAVKQFAEIVDEKKEQIDIIAKTTVNLDKKIHSDLSGLYKELRIEETNALLDRLIIEPQDVGNLCTLLCARDIDETGYAKLKTAYLKMKRMLVEPMQGNCVCDYSEDFLVLFYQHFFSQAIKDEEVSPDFESYYGEIFARAYRRDVIKSTHELCQVLSEETSCIEKDMVLITYLKALNCSQYSKLTELKNVFEQNIIPRTLLQNAIEHCITDNVYLSFLGITPPPPLEDISRQ